MFGDGAELAAAKMLRTQVRVKSEQDHEDYAIHASPPLGAAAAAAAAAAGGVGRMERLDLPLETGGPDGGGGGCGAGANGARGVRAAGDVKVTVRDETKGGKALCFFWVHTQASSHTRLQI